jgi:pimeloyl-ACP methyl ester carboxylesterase
MEIAQFANDHPDRLKKAVFIDAAYDWLMNAEAKGIPSSPIMPEPGPSDVASAATFAAYWARMEGVPAYPEADIRATWTFSDNGSILAPVTPPAISAALGAAAAASHPDSASIRVPALAIYTVPEKTADMFPWIGYSPEQEPTAAAFLSAMQPLMAEQRDAFAKAVPQASIIEMQGMPHYVFLLQPGIVAQDIRSFLLQ